MSDLYVRVIPTDPEWQPTAEAAAAAVEYVAGLLAGRVLGHPVTQMYTTTEPASHAGSVPWRVRLEALLHLSSNFAYPLSLALALLLGGLALLPPDARTAGVFAWLEATTPLGMASTLAYVAYYVAAQRGVRGPVAALVRVPLVMAVGLGLSVTQTRAVLSGLGERGGEFVRTPKTGAIGKAVAPRRPHARRWPLAEALAALYSVVAAGAAVAGGHWLVVPYLALAAIGFAWVAAGLVLE